ncbi:MAG: hypothetical protein E5X57_31395 [Mesorhizobium sp.]|nr:MAG: hypothetical protein EOS08_24705 [Mesorhizobium sp.]TIQ03161.1 MAG: hypothetical protein E5X57_31395 [Mesorhizobium sp.]
MKRDYFWLSEQQFARLEPLLPTDTRGRLPVADRSRGPWVDVQPVYGSRKTSTTADLMWCSRHRNVPSVAVEIQSQTDVRTGCSGMPSSSRSQLTCLREHAHLVPEQIPAAAIWKRDDTIREIILAT